MAVVNDIGSLDAGAFEGGPSFQKAACLPRRFGRPMHGAHSHALTRAGFRIRHAEAPEIGSRLATDDAQASCGKFEEFAGYERDDPALSEIGASRRCPARSKPDRMREPVADRNPRFAAGRGGAPGPIRKTRSGGRVSVLEKYAASADCLEQEAFREFLEEQDIKSTLPPGADAARSLREHIELRGDLRFVLPGSCMPPFSAPPGTGPSPAGEPAKARPVSELSPRTRKQARRARPRNLVQALNTAMALALWVLLVSFAVRFVEVPLNYVLGAAFSTPLVLLSARWLRNARRRRL